MEKSVLIDMRDKKYWELRGKEYLGNGYWRFECSCGKEVIAKGTSVRNGNTKSCGHTRGSKKVIDLKNKQIGLWKVEEYIGNSYWRCRCECGEVKDVHSYSLRNNKTFCCGAPIHRVSDLRNKRFGILKVISYTGNKLWKCECKCGRIIEVRACNLTNGSTRSCGCETQNYYKETMIDRYGDIAPRRINSPRELELIKDLDDPNSIERLAIEFNNHFGYKPSYSEIAESLDIHKVTLKSRVEKFGLASLFKEEMGHHSSYENEIIEIIKSMNNDIVLERNKKGIIDNMELDIYLPELKLAIEFNGDYWHDELHKDKRYHQNKTAKCIRKGIRVIHIFEYEWKDNKTKKKIITLIKRSITGCSRNIMARKTKVREIDKKECNEFLDKYHIQNGSTLCEVNIGCFYNDEMIGVMGLGRSRFDSRYDYELIRLCWKDDVAVTGGSDKIMK